MTRKKQCIYIHMGTTDTNIYNWVGAHQSTKWFFIYHSSLEWTWNSEWLLVLRRGVNTRQNGEKRLRVGERTNYERNPNQPSTKNLVMPSRWVARVIMTFEWLAHNIFTCFYTLISPQLHMQISFLHMVVEDIFSCLTMTNNIIPPHCLYLLAR